MPANSELANGFGIVRPHAVSSSKSELSQSSFDHLLAWLDPDRDEAGRKYELIRRKLISIFTSRRFEFPEELADKTIDRVLKKVPGIAATYEGDPALYFLGVARNISREYLRPGRIVEPPPAAHAAESDTARAECLEECLEHVLPRNRQMLIEYYQDDGQAKIDHRKALALRYGLGTNALRIRLYRIRSTVAECAMACVERRNAQR